MTWQQTIDLAAKIAFGLGGLWLIVIILMILDLLAIWPEPFWGPSTKRKKLAFLAALSQFAIMALSWTAIIGGVSYGRLGYVTLWVEAILFTVGSIGILIEHHWAPWSSSQHGNDMRYCDHVHHPGEISGPNA